MSLDGGHMPYVAAKDRKKEEKRENDYIQKLSELLKLTYQLTPLL